MSLNLFLVAGQVEMFGLGRRIEKPQVPEKLHRGPSDLSSEILLHSSSRKSLLKHLLPLFLFSRKRSTKHHTARIPVYSSLKNICTYGSPTLGPREAFVRLDSENRWMSSRKAERSHAWSSASIRGNPISGDSQAVSLSVWV